MNLPGRTLSLGTIGNDVETLHHSLRQLGYSIDEDEVDKRRYDTSTLRAVMAFQKARHLVMTGIVDDATAAAMHRELELAAKGEAYIVRGTVRNPNGKPVVGAEVRVFDRDLRSEQLLGEGTTDKRGRYEISYTTARFKRAEKRTADLAVKIFENKKPVHEPGIEEILFNAPAVAVVDIRLKQGETRVESEFEKIIRSISPLLEQLPIAELREDGPTRDITFINRETAWPLDKLEHLVVAHRLERIAKIRPDFFYALLREDTLLRIDFGGTIQARFSITIATELEPLFFDIVLLAPEKIRGGVAAAIKHGYVPADLADELGQILEMLARRRDEAERYARDEQPKKIFRMISANIAAGKHLELMEILSTDARGDLMGLVDRLSKLAILDDGADPTHVAGSLALGELLGFEGHLVDAVRREHGVEKPEDLRKLASLDRPAWRAALETAATSSAASLAAKSSGKASVKESGNGAEKATAKGAAKGSAGKESASTESSATASAAAVDPKMLDFQASLLVRKMERRFPTAAFTAQLKRDAKSAMADRPGLAELLDAHPDLDLRSTNIGEFLRKKKISPADDDPNGARATLEKLQRVFKLAPTYRKTDALLKEGIDSAASIYAMGKTHFVKKMSESGTFTRKEAAEVYNKAADTHVAATMIAAELRATAGAADIAALSSPMMAMKLKAVTKDFPNLKSLFKTIDMCGCDHCRSVYSPAAYLVDTFQFLKNRLVVDTTAGPGSVKKAKEVLFSRRPDLGDLDLSCENTNTPLPYIDLVCELLEDAVAPEAGVPYNGPIARGKISSGLYNTLKTHFPLTESAMVFDHDLEGGYVVRDAKVVCKIIPDGMPDTWKVKRLRQTHLSAAELSAAPEYLNTDAYETLRTTNYAFNLPFDLFHQEGRGYFEQFGTRRDELMRALKLAAGPSDAAIAADGLGIADDERALIADSAAGDPARLRAYWNTGADEAREKVKVVDTFLTKSELAYEDLEELLRRRFINPSGAMYIKHLDTTCDTAQKVIDKLDDAAVDALHRFIRLWRRIGWSAPELDRAIMAPRIGGGHLNDTTIARLGAVVRLKEDLHLAIDDVSSFYGPIPAEGSSSRYARLFLNEAANGAIEPMLLPERVAKNETDEQTTPGSGVKIAPYTGYLALSLGAKREEVKKLVDSLGASAVLTFDNIARVHAMNVLAAALGLDASSLLTLIELTGIQPLADPFATLRFVEKARALRAAGLRPSDLAYLLKHAADDPAARDMAPAAVAAMLGRLRTAYAAAAQGKSPFDGDVTIEENRKVLAELLGQLPGYPGDASAPMPDADRAKVLAIVDGTYADAMPASDFIDSRLGPCFDTAQIKARMTELAAAAPPRTAERLALLRALIDPIFLYLARLDLLIAEVAATYVLEPDVAAAFVRGARMKAPAPVAGRTVLELLMAPALSGNLAINDGNFPNQYSAAKLLHAIAAMLVPVPLTPREIAWMLKHNGALGWMELDGLCYDAGIPAVPFDRWERLQGAVALARENPPVENRDDPRQPITIYSVFDLVLAPGATIAAVTALLARLTGLDATVLADLDTHFGFSTPNLDKYRLPETYGTLREAATLVRALGVDVATAKTLAKPRLGDAEVASLRRALKARYTESDWLGVLGGIQDGLRTKKRDALVAFLLAENPEMKSSDDLFDYFLVDVEMCACQPTSRIVQAHGTVQLFVQRCRMGLEPTSVANVTADGDWEQWTWMRNYRVWEANRKIFLYPENWIEPELRDDKSFFFTEIENQLLQNELSDRAVEDAMIGYLEKLDEIAMLEVVTVYYQTDIRTMHVFARTKGGDPPVYYYRRFEKEQYWTPWEKVDLDISGDHLMAFMRNNRLYLAWPLFTEQPNERQSITIPSSTVGTPVPRTEKQLRVQLAISEQAGKKWRPKKISKQGLVTSWYSRLPRREDFRFMPLDLGTVGFYITCSYIENGTWTNGVDGAGGTNFLGLFMLTGCKGYPEPVQGASLLNYYRFLPQFRDTALQNLRFAEQGQDAPDDLAIKSIFDQDFRELLNATPGTFRVTYPQQMSLIDIILFTMQFLMPAMPAMAAKSHEVVSVPLGTHMPYFYEDGQRGFVLLPGFYGGQGGAISKTFSDILKFTEDCLALATKYLQELQADPNHDLGKMLSDLVKDPEFIRLWDELMVYLSLDYGVRFKSFYHPLVCQLRATLYRDGIPGLMRRDTQLVNTGFHFGAGPTYDPQPLVATPYPIEDIDFSQEGSYSSYNWELFFHLPLMIAVKLSKDQRFEEAMTWFHYIFNPIGASDGPAPQKYWVTKPFYQATDDDYRNQRIDKILSDIASDPTGATISDLEFALGEWRDKPFKPHVIARTRPVAYQKAVLMKYIDNLIAWGDNLFRQDTMESVNQATQMYILADKLLGPKPRVVPPAVPVPVETFNQLEAKIDLFGNALLTIENLLPDLHLPQQPNDPAPPVPLTVSCLYFCIPQNDKMLEYWDLVADRLFKVRHCQNIDGVERVLALFAPPIDPGMLVRAAAAGLDISDVLAGMSAPLPLYRFGTMAQKATELAQQVSGLGAALLAALEKRDAEGLSRLRAEQEVKVLGAVRQVKERQIQESEAQIEALKLSKGVIEERLKYYQTIKKVLPKEQLHIDKLGQAHTYQEAAQGVQLAASLIALIPDIDLGASGFGGTPLAKFKFGGLNLAQASKAASDVLSFLALMSTNDASMAAIAGGNDRRWEG